MTSQFPHAQAVDEVFASADHGRIVAPHAGAKTGEFRMECESACASDRASGSRPRRAKAAAKAKRELGKFLFASTDRRMAKPQAAASFLNSTERIALAAGPVANNELVRAALLSQ